MTSEDVQQRAGEQKEKGESAEQVRSVFGPEQHDRHRAKGQEDEKGPRGPKARCPAVWTLLDIDAFHCPLLVTQVRRCSGAQYICAGRVA